HRDLKPSNILVTPRDHAKVLDLGLALSYGETGDALVVGGQGYILGTMDYIAPEQAENAARVETSCDIYSLGCSIYFAMTGQPPFPGGSALEKIQKHRSADPPAIPLLNPTVAPGFIGIVRKMMAKQPAQRFASAAEVRDKLTIWASEDFVLPLDERGDREYQEAVAALEQATPPTDVLLETLPVPPPAIGVADSGTNVIALMPESPSRFGPLAWFLGALGLATVVLMGLAVAIFLHWR
ncbi:MAG TPA: serine/threonine-protein kinase, partial [Gemmataceae bacterium]|nr:serine/threonine-protein kinase [Gemmataceae bacterium]